MLIALVPKLICDDSWVESLDACNVYGIPTLDGYLCDLKSKEVRKRRRTDYFSTTFSVNRPGQNQELYEEMKQFINDFACGRKQLADFMVKS